MMLFWLCALMMALLAALLLASPLLGSLHDDERSLVSLNVQVFRERLAELEKDLAENRIDAETFAGLKTELERNMLNLADAPEHPQRQQKRARALFLLLVLALPAMAASFYYFVQFNPALPAWWESQRVMQPVIEDILAGRQPSTDASQTSLPDFIRALQLRMQRTPENAQGWFMIGIGYMQMNMGAQALQAFERAWRLDPKRPEVQLAYAQAQVFTNEGKLTPQSQQLLEGVLASHPRHEGALILLGVGAYRSGDYALAVKSLEQLEALRQTHSDSANSEATQELDKMLADAKAQLASGAIAAAPAGGITVDVSIDPTLAAKVQPGDTLFVFAKAQNGPPMPLAVVRRPAGGLPFAVELNDSQSMIPSMKLSSVTDVVVSARISHSGSPLPEAGDLEAVALPLHQSGKSVHVDLQIRQLHQ
jgi:cytochrome c-type biogenesis protein CcmH